jgi:hypothetical protein
MLPCNVASKHIAIEATMLAAQIVDPGLPACDVPRTDRCPELQIMPMRDASSPSAPLCRTLNANRLPQP